MSDVGRGDEEAVYERFGSVEEDEDDATEDEDAADDVPQGRAVLLDEGGGAFEEGRGAGCDADDWEDDAADADADDDATSLKSPEALILFA
jgi:hypothetical protein